MKLYVRLYSEINGAWQSNDYTFAETGTGTQAVITSPAAGVLPVGPTQTFIWSSGTGVTAYMSAWEPRGPDRMICA